MNNIFETKELIEEVAVTQIDLVKTNNVTIVLTLVFVRASGDKISILHENLKINHIDVTDSLEIMQILAIFKLFQRNELNKKMENPYFTYAERGANDSKERSLNLNNTKFHISNVNIVAAAIAWNGAYLKQMRYNFSFKVFQANKSVAYYFEGINVDTPIILNEKKFKKIVKQLIENGFCKKKINYIIHNTK